MTMHIRLRPAGGSRLIAPLPGCVATLRPGEGRFGGAVAVEEETTNLAASSESRLVFVDDWHAWEGANVVLTQGQPFPEIGRGDATRIQITGGTGTLKYLTSFGETEQGKEYTGSVYIKNIGSAPVVVRTNLGGSNLRRVHPGEWGRVVLSSAGSGTGSHFQLRFQAESADDELDFIAWGPQGEEKPFATSFVDGTRPNGHLLYQPEIMPQNNFTFIAWWKPVVPVGAGLPSSNNPRFFSLYEAVPTGAHTGAGTAVQLERRQSGGGIVQNGIRLRVPNADGDGAVGLIVAPEAPMDETKWHFVAASVSGREMRLQLDDQVETLVLNAPPAQFVANYLSIGTVSTITGTSARRATCLNGLLDDLYIGPALPDELIEAARTSGQPMRDSLQRAGVGGVYFPFDHSLNGLQLRETIRLPKTFALDVTDVSVEQPRISSPGRDGQIRQPIRRIAPRSIRASGSVRGIDPVDVDRMSEQLRAQLLTYDEYEISRSDGMDRFIRVGVRRITHDYHRGRFSGSLASFQIQFDADSPWWHDENVQIIERYVQNGEVFDIEQPGTVAKQAPVIQIAGPAGWSIESPALENVDTGDVISYDGEIESGQALLVRSQPMRAYVGDAGIDLAMDIWGVWGAQDYQDGEIPGAQSALTQMNEAWLLHGWFLRPGVNRVKYSGSGPALIRIAWRPKYY